MRRAITRAARRSGKSISPTRRIRNWCSRVRAWTFAGLYARTTGCSPCCPIPAARTRLRRARRRVARRGARPTVQGQGVPHLGHERRSSRRRGHAPKATCVAPEFHVLDMSGPQAKLQRVGSRFPGLDKTDLAQHGIPHLPGARRHADPGFPHQAGERRGTLPPLIIMPHGGPWARDAWGFDSWVQVLAREGYAVLQMNYRGSGGYGKKWREASLQGLGWPAVLGHHRRAQVGGRAEAWRPGARVRGRRQFRRLSGAGRRGARQPDAQMRGECRRRQRPARAQERFDLLHELTDRPAT